MTDQPKKPKIEKLELNAETVADLTAEEAEGVQGGRGTAGCLLSAGDCAGQTGANCYTVTPGACPITHYCPTGPNVC